jgi:hypothetical protein
MLNNDWLVLQQLSRLNWTFRSLDRDGIYRMSQNVLSVVGYYNL